MTIKTSDLRACDACGQSINPIFFRLQVSLRHLAIDRTAVNEVLGTSQILGGSLFLGSIMSPNRDATIELDGYKIDRDLFICPRCIGEFKIDVLEMMAESETAVFKEETP